VSVDPTQISRDDTSALAPTIYDGEDDPLGGLPRLTRRQVALDRRFSRLSRGSTIPEMLFPGLPIEVGVPDILWRPSGLNRPGAIAQLAWTRLNARIGIGIETPLAHAAVDHLLGFSRTKAESQRQVTPVEWGILGLVIARALDRLDEQSSSIGARELAIDRVGPDPFDPRDLGPIVTWRWPVRLGEVEGSVRFWVPESVLARFDDLPPPAIEPRPVFAELGSDWRAEAGTITLPRGLSRVKKGGVLPIDGASLKGTVASPSGRIALVCDDRDGRSWFDTEATPGASGLYVTINSTLRREPTPKEPRPVNPTTSAPATQPDIPVTLVVELGRLNLTLTRLGELKPGDVVELGRHAREPVELTSNGRLVARGELVQIDTDLGVRISSVFL
jgi:flagellar motor switch protein FliN